MKAIVLKLILTFFIIAIIILRLIYPDINFDTISLGLVFFGLIPWIPTFLKSSRLPGGWEQKFKELYHKQKHQQNEIHTLNFLITHFLTDEEFEHLDKLARREAFYFRKSTNTAFEKELRKLRSLKLIRSYPGKGMKGLLKKDEGNVSEYFYITKQGMEFLKLHRMIRSVEHEAPASRPSAFDS